MKTKYFFNYADPLTNPMKFQLAVLIAWTIFSIQLQESLAQGISHIQSQSATFLPSLKKSNSFENISKDGQPGDPHERKLSSLTSTFNVSSDYNVFIITFSQNITLESVNETLFDVELPPYTNNVEYNFSVIKLADNQSVEIDVYYIKTVARQTITITFYHNNSFEDADPNDPVFTTISTEILFKLSPSATAVDTALRTGINISFGVLMFGLFVCFFTKERATLLWNNLDFMQMMFILFFAGTELPWNLRAIIIGLSVSALHFLPNAFHSLAYPVDASTTYIANPSWDSFIFCFWPWFMIALITGTFQAIIYITYRATNSHPSSQVKVIPFLHLVHWSGLLRLFFAGFLAISFAAVSQFASISSDAIEIAGAVMGFIVLVGFFAVTLILVRVMRVDKQKLRHDTEYRARFIVLYEGLKLRKTITKYWNFIDLARKFLIALIVGALHNFPYIQMSILIIQNVVYLTIFSIYRPYLATKHNGLTILREVFTIPVYALVLAFAVDDKTGLLGNNRVFTGWAIALFITLIYCLHAIWFVIDALLSIKKKPEVKGEEEEDDPTPQLPTIKVHDSADMTVNPNQSIEHLMNNEAKLTRNNSQVIMLPTDVQGMMDSVGSHYSKKPMPAPKRNSFVTDDETPDNNNKPEGKPRSQMELTPALTKTISRDESLPQSKQHLHTPGISSGNTSHAAWRNNSHVKHYTTNEPTDSTQDCTNSSHKSVLVFHKKGRPNQNKKLVVKEIW